MSGTLPTPRSTARIASSRYGTRSRFTMKPELSLAATGSLPSEAAKAKARLKVCSDVVMVRTTSTSGITGTGLKKCSPTKRSARFVAPAISAIVRLDVLEAKIVPGPHKPSSSRKSTFLSARSSVIASITMSTVRRSATTVVNFSRLSAASRSAGWSLPFSTSLPSDFSMPARPRSRISLETSRTMVSYPAVAATWAMPLPIKPQPSTPTRWMSANSSAPGFWPRGRSRTLERFADFFGDPDECLRAGEHALAGRADVAALQPIEHLLQCDFEALVRAPVGAGDHSPSRRHTDAWYQHQCLGERERRSDQCDRACHPPAQDCQDRGAGDPLRTLLADVRLESHEAESRLELHDLRGHLAGLCQRVAPSSRERALNRRECAGFGLPRRAVGEMPFGLQQLFLDHPPAQLALDRGAIAGNDPVRHNRPGPAEPRPRPGRELGGNARLLLEHCLAQIAVRNADVFPERQDLGVRETVTDVVFSGLQLGGALDDALERLTADEVASFFGHQTLARPLLRGAGNRSPAMRSGSARLPESLACTGARRSMKPLNKSIGIGKIVVELFSDAISLTVCR